MKLRIYFFLSLFTLMLAVYFHQVNKSNKGDDNRSSAVKVERGRHAFASSANFANQFFIVSEHTQPVKGDGRHDPARESKEEEEVCNEDETGNGARKNHSESYCFSIPFCTSILYYLHNTCNYNPARDALSRASYCKYILFNVFRV